MQKGQRRGSSGPPVDEDASQKPVSSGRRFPKKPLNRNCNNEEKTKSSH